MVKKLIQFLVIVLLLEVPLLAMDKFGNASKTIIVKQEFVEDDFSDWFLVPLVQQKPLVERGLDIFDVFSSKNDPAPSIRKKQRDDNIPMELLGISY